MKKFAATSLMALSLLMLSACTPSEQIDVPVSGSQSVSTTPQSQDEQSGQSGKSGDDAQSGSLEAPEYTLTKMTDAEGKETDVSHANAWATVMVDEGQTLLTGNAGCNGFSAAVAPDNSLGDAMSTMMYCEDTMDVENQFLEILQGGTLEIKGTTIDVRSPQGTLEFTLPVA